MKRKHDWSPISTAPLDGQTILATDGIIEPMPVFWFPGGKAGGCWAIRYNGKMAVGLKWWQRMPPLPYTM